MSAPRGSTGPPGEGLEAKLLRREPKSVASRYYQLLSGHTAIGPYLKDKIHKTDDGRCQWCRRGKKQTRHHLFMEHGVQGLAPLDLKAVERYGGLTGGNT